MSKELKTFMGIISVSPILFLIGLVFSFLLFQWFPYQIVHSLEGKNILSLIGIVFIMGGTLLAFMAQRISRIVTNPQHKATCPTLMQGPYAYSRHPGSLALIIMYIGFTFIVNAWVMVLLALVLIGVLSFIFVPAQEKVIAELCPESYAEYKSKVRMWL